MIIVAGHLIVDAESREKYLEGCRDVVTRARKTPGCADFGLSADLVDPRRINVYERWTDVDALQGFRGAGSSEEQNGQIRDAEVREFETDDGRPAG